MGSYIPDTTKWLPFTQAMAKSLQMHYISGWSPFMVMVLDVLGVNRCRHTMLMICAPGYMHAEMYIIRLIRRAISYIVPLNATLNHSRYTIVAKINSVQK